MVMAMSARTLWRLSDTARRSDTPLDSYILLDLANRGAVPLQVQKAKPAIVLEPYLGQNAISYFILKSY